MQSVTAATPAQATGVPVFTTQPAGQLPSRAVRDIDVLQKASYIHAEKASATVRVYGKDGRPALQLKEGAFHLRVNGTARTAQVSGLLQGGVAQVPLVLVVFPPNQREVRQWGAQQAKRYFGSLDPQLKWKVAVLDGDGSVTTYTRQRDQVLQDLKALSQRVEPIVSGGGESAWLGKAQYAVAQMRSWEGPKILLAFNRAVDQLPSEGQATLARDGPESLTDVARAVGAHIYIANVGGPGVLVPGGDASHGGGADPLGALMLQPQQMLRLLSYRTTMMHMTARDTMGGFANAVDELGGRIEGDIEASYRLEFALTPKDRDKGVPEVEVRVDDASERVMMMDVSPLGPEAERQSALRLRTATLWRETNQLKVSPEIRIAQRADYFPVRGGEQAILPMSAVVRWLGGGQTPTLHIAEYVQNLDLDVPVLERELQGDAPGQGVSWERDGRLTPGRYAWRVVVLDERDRVLASAEERILVGVPENANVPTSSLVVGTGCRTGEGETGLRRRVAGRAEDTTPRGFPLDPLRTESCRLQPSATGTLRAGEVARALIRIYPAGKLEREGPERWSARFLLEAADGGAEESVEGAFRLDSGGGFVAQGKLPLLRQGRHVISVEVNGPGFKKPHVESRSVVVMTAGDEQ